MTPAFFPSHVEPVRSEFAATTGTVDWAHAQRAFQKRHLLAHKMTEGSFASIGAASHDYFQSRHERYEAVAPLHYGGFMDRLHFRLAIDKMNAEDTPLTTFVKMRDAEDAKVANEFYGPIFTAVITFLVIGFAGKYGP